MRLSGSAQQVWVFIGESDQWHGRPLYLAILELLKREGGAGGTVLRGIAGFGADNLIRTSSLVELSMDLPIIVTFVDRADRVERLLPQIEAMVAEGMITVMPVEVVKYTHRVGGAFPPHLTVRDVMTRDVVTVGPDTPIDEIVTLLIDRGVKAVPVVDSAGHPVGILTDGDLLRRGRLDLPVHLQQALPLEQRAEAAKARRGYADQASELMTPNPHTIGAAAPLAQAAQHLAEYDLKRLAVVDDEERLVGIVSRSDLLATVAEGLRQRPEEPVSLQTGAPQSVADVMLRDVPTGHRDTPLAAALDALLETPQQRVVVIDDDRHVVGLITDGDILQRAARRVQPSVLQRLARWFGGGARPAELMVAAKGRTAGDVMSHPVVTLRASTPIIEGIQRMMEENHKRMPVVDEEGRLVGLVGRAGLMKALAHE